MEQKERFILEIITGVIFLAFLILGTIVVVNASEGSETETTITNSFNTYNLYSDGYPTRMAMASSKPYIVDRSDYSRDRYLRYDDIGNFRPYKGVFGNDVNRYEVHVRNEEYVGGYFKTIFYFEDYYGNVDSKVMTHYIPARDEKVFFITDVSPSKYEYRSWWYDTVSLTKTPYKTNSY